jgi:hypothetical protein
MTPTSKLRQLAEGATRGIWDSAVWHGSNEDSWTATGPIHTFGDDPHEPLDPESETAKRAERDSAFIAAASPDVVIALLDQLTAMTAARDEACEIVERWCDARRIDGQTTQASLDRDRLDAIRTIGKAPQ